MKIFIIVALVVVISAIKAAPNSVVKIGVVLPGEGHLNAVASGAEDTGDLNQRSNMTRCIYNVCICYPGTPQGQYCLGDEIYECNPSGGCCLYGFSNACSQCGRPRC
jgi:hypothetical protein